MTITRKIDMNEVTRLTREGRLMEAMTMLRGGVGNSSEIHGRTTSADAPLTIDMVPVPEEAERWKHADPSFASASTRFARGKERFGKVSQNQEWSLPHETIPFPGERGRSRLWRAPPQTPAPDGARFLERRFSNEAGTRSYKLYIPSTWNQQPAPLIIMLHGCTQSPDDFARGTRMNEIAEQEGFLVAYPAQSQAANASRCWNWFMADHQGRGEGEPSLIAGITRQIMQDFAVDPTRVYVAGLSAGGAAAAIMGSAYPDLYAAVGVHSGLACGAADDMPSAFEAMRKGGAQSSENLDSRQVIPSIVFHGDSDNTVNCTNADQIIEQARGGARLTRSVDRGEAGGMAFTRTTEAHHDGRSIIEQWTLHGGGHAWSGGSPDGSYTDQRGPDASREMIRFFRQHASGSSPNRRA